MGTPSSLIHEKHELGNKLHVVALLSATAISYRYHNMQASSDRSMVMMMRSRREQEKGEEEGGGR